MVTTKDILFEILMAIYWLASSALLVIFVHPVLIIPNFILVIFFKARRKRRKSIAPFVKEDFLKIGYHILNERPLKFSEEKFEISIAPTINSVPVSRYGYLRRFTRIFSATKSNGEKVILNTVITKGWNGKIKIEILSIKNVAKHAL